MLFRRPKNTQEIYPNAVYFKNTKKANYIWYTKRRKMLQKSLYIFVYTTYITYIFVYIYRQGKTK